MIRKENVMADKKLLIPVIVCMLLTTAVSAQKKSFTLDDLLSGGETFWNLQPKNIYTAWWGDCLVRLDASQCTAISNAKGKKNKKEEILFTLEQINASAGMEGEKVRSLYYASFDSPGKTEVTLKTSKHRVIIDWKEGRVIRRQPLVPQSVANDYNPASGNEAYVLKNNLYVITAAGKVHQLSHDGSSDLVYGQSVHRDEFGIRKGTFWSPQGNRLAFYKMDQSMVTDYPLVDVTPLCADNCKDSAGVSRIAKLTPIKYPMAGETSHKVYVGVFDVLSGKTVYLKTADPTDRYFTNISWSPDEKTVYVFELNRDQNHMELMAYDAVSGECLGKLFEEKHPKYVEPQNPLVFLPWDDRKFVFQSQRDGFNHLYLYDLDSKETSQLTKGNFVVTEFVGFDSALKNIIFISNECSPIQYNTYSLNLKTLRRTLLDDGTGVHSAGLSASGRYVLDRYSSPSVPRSINIIDTRSGKRENILTAEDPWKEYNVPEITCGTIKAADGTTDLYYRMVKPVDFDANKKYPAVVYVYGGPHARNVTAARNYLTRGWEIYMAQKGYLVFILDNRGSEHRGLEFENVTFRHLGVEEMKDQIKGVEFLKSLPYVDGSKLGVHGWSYGGFMTINLMLTYPDVFKVGVAGGPVIDWKYYEVMYGERYMDTPQQNPDGYRECSLLNKAGNLKGRLQIINGLNDPTCVPQHTFSFLRACEDAGTQPDYFTYPGDGHNMMGKDMVHLHERITRYFTDYLK